MPATDRRADVALLTTVLIWGANFPVIKVALGPMPPFVVNACRFTFSVLALGGVYAWQRRGQPGRFWAPLREQWKTILWLSLLGYALYQLVFILGIARTSAGSAALIMASAPMWTAVFARFIGLERLPLLGWFGLAVSLSGTVLVVLGGQADFSEDTLGGNLLILGAAVLWALYTVLSRPILSTDISASGLALFSILLALPLLYGLGLTELEAVAWEEVDLAVVGALLFSGALSTGLAYWFWNLGVRLVGPSQAAVWNNLVPVVALVTGFLLLGEPVTLFQFLGGALIIGGLVLIRQARRHFAPVA